MLRYKIAPLGQYIKCNATEKWILNDIEHRIGAAANIDHGKPYIEYWVQHGFPHNICGPAVVIGDFVKMYYRYGKLYNGDEPAVFVDYVD